MTSPRTHLRLVGRPATDDGEDFDPVDRAPHDLHGAYHELGDGGHVPSTSAFDEEAEAALDADAPRSPSSLRFAVVALVAFQLMAVLAGGSRYLALVGGEDVYRVAAVFSVPGALCLYAGAALLAARPGRGRGLFLAATVGLGLSLPAWGVSASWSWPIAFGALLALAGAWVAKPAAQAVDEEFQAQP